LIAAGGIGELSSPLEQLAKVKTKSKADIMARLFFISTTIFNY
jgi:hypothetical protein